MLNFIDFVEEKENFRDIRVVYEQLCEYCHPNSASRTLDFHSHVTGHVKQLLFKGGVQFTVGFIRVFGLVRSVLPRLCDRFVEDLQLLADATMPMQPLHGDAVECVPKPGMVRVDDIQTARAFWVKRDEICEPGFNRAALTEKQKRRIEDIANAFSRVLFWSREEWFKSFSGDMDVERELELVEHLVAVYNCEVADRGSPSLDERNLLCIAIYEGDSCKDVGELLSISPELKRLPMLERVLRRVKRQGRLA